MPEIGRPGQTNPFARIAKAQGGVTAKNPTKAPANLAESLNEIAGIEEEKQFVDRATHNKMGKDGFLKLLSFQLQNQDPIKPMDQKQFASDLAQFSQLEQLTNMNSKFDKLGSNASQETKFYGASFLGKEILTQGSSVHYDGEKRNLEIPFYLDKSAKNVTVNIYDSKRQLMAKVEASDLSKGQNKINWNGKQLDGVRATKDDYTLEVVAYDEEMNRFKAQTNSKGLVTGVHFANGETILTLENGKEVFLRDVDRFNVDSNKQNTATQQTVPSLQQKAINTYNNINESL